MGAVVSFPSVFRDYTDSFTEWRQQTFRSLPAEMKQFVSAYESAWQARWMAGIPSTDRSNLVHPGILVGGYASVADDGPGDDVDVVLNMAVEFDYTLKARTQLVKIGIDDGRMTNVGVFEMAADIINRSRVSGKTVLVHCAAGVSRSSTAVLAYLMLYEGMGWSKALEYVQARRACINPHPLLMRSVIRDLGSDFIP